MNDQDHDHEIPKIPEKGSGEDTFPTSTAVPTLLLEHCKLQIINKNNVTYQNHRPLFFLSTLLS